MAPPGPSATPWTGRARPPRRSDVRVTERLDVPRVRLRVRPRIQDRIGPAERRVLTDVARLVLPDPPQPVEVSVVHPEDRVGRGVAHERHRAAHPDVHAAVDAV